MSNSGELSGKAVPEPVRKCDHICLLDEGHVERGEAHFYGYEHPSPRDNVIERNYADE
jgi:hypothetical protein